MKPYAKLAAIAILLQCLSACAVRHTPSQFTPLQEAAQAPERTLAQQAAFTLDTGYARTLKAGSAWRQAGTIPQGMVYRPVRDVFTLEGANIHEAYLVVRGDALVGFYLPAERGFSQLQSPVPLHFNH
jgi:hypothetical protein